MRYVKMLAAISVAGVLGAGGVAAAVAAAPPPAHLEHTVGLKEVGPIDETNGFPLWYKDTNGVKLELCTDPNDPYCIMGEVPDPTAPVHFPDNFPDEAFWAAAESPIDAGGGDTGILVTALEAAFQNELPAVNEGVSFGRVRIRVAGVIDGETYRVTHPFGTDTIVAETGAVKGLNVTEDIGSLTWDGVFDQTLAARVGPFLRWDPEVAPAAPAGYLGDVGVEHTVIGSPYDTNFFRVEGPAGSFTGSTQLCADPALGDSPTATDDCIENDQFAVQGKIATRMGVQVLRANYRDTGGSNSRFVDLWAKSEPGQKLVVSGTGVSQTILADSGKGEYFARIAVDGEPPADLVVTNQSDTPDTSDHVDAAMFGDKVHVISATWDTGSHDLQVVADSGVSSATLVLEGYDPDLVHVDVAGSLGVRTFTVADLPSPPAEVSVTSDKGGSDQDDVVITGGEFDSAQVVAAITADSNEITVNQPLTLDSIASQGTITAREWSISNGGTLSSTSAPSVQFVPASPGDYTITLKVTGPGNGNDDTVTFDVHVGAAATPPAVNAGPDQLNVVPSSVVSLNGAGSLYTTSYSWAAPAGITLTGAGTANPTFVVPVTTSDASWTFTLTATGPGGSATDTVTVTSDVDDVTVDAAQYKRGGLEWRIRGAAQYCSANNTVRVYWNKPGAARVLLGTATPAGDLGVCGYDFRLKNTPAALRPTGAGTITVESGLGGVVANRAFLFL